MRFTGSECYGTWFSDAVSSEEGDLFEQFDTFRSQIKITQVDPWVGDTITVHYRTEGVLNNGEKVEVTLYNKQGDVEVDHKELAVVSKWNNFQQMTFTVPNNSGEKFYFYARILTSNGEGFNAWIDPASVDTTKP
jgi:hypothetical protein